MRLSSLALLAGATAVAADNTVTLFLPGFDAFSIDGKVIGTKGSATSYLLNCPPGTDEDECGLPEQGYTVLQGPSTMQMGYTNEGLTISQGCDLQGTTHAVCSASYIEHGRTSSLSTAVDVATIPYGGYQAVHITATQTGASATTGASASASTAASTGANSASASDSASSTGATTGSTATTSNTQTTQSTPTNAAMPVATGNAHWVVGGVAAALALAVV